MPATRDSSIRGIGAIDCSGRRRTRNFLERETPAVNARRLVQKQQPQAGVLGSAVISPLIGNELVL
jgi:hypothetical protein